MMPDEPDLRAESNFTRVEFSCKEITPLYNNIFSTFVEMQQRHIFRKHWRLSKVSLYEIGGIFVIIVTDSTLQTRLSTATDQGRYPCFTFAQTNSRFNFYSHHYWYDKYIDFRNGAEITGSWCSVEVFESATLTLKHQAAGYLTVVYLKTMKRRFRETLF